MPRKEGIGYLPSMRLPTLEQLRITPMSEIQRYWMGVGLSTSLFSERVCEFETIGEFQEYYRLLRKEALAGVDNAWNELGWLWMNGFFLAKDHEQAVRVLQIATQFQCPEAHYNLGLIYGYMGSPHRNQPEALPHLEQAYGRGILLAAYSLGELYEGNWVAEQGEVGVFVEPDPKRSWEWYLRGAQGGHVWASMKVALRQLEGTGLSGSVEDGVNLLKQAAEYALGAEPAEALMEFYLVTQPGSDEYHHWRDRAIAMNSSQARRYRAYDAHRQASEKEKQA